jgi:Fic family protein
LDGRVGGGGIGMLRTISRQNVKFEHLDQLKAKLDHFRPLPKNIVKNLHENLVLQWIYHSNAIEGNSLTLKETKVVLEGHQLVLKNINDQYAGVYRDHHKMIDFIKWYHTTAIQLHPIERSARVHGEFVKIHPFADGNGRTSRLSLIAQMIMNPLFN